jgi:apolipoprotein N-acyltransferase
MNLPARPTRRLHQLGVCAVTALLWIVAAPPYGLWPLAWIAMVPLLWLLADARTPRRAGLLGWSTGAMMTLGGFYWFAPLMHEHAKLPWPLAVLCLVALAAWQGLALMLSARAIWWIRRWKKLPMAVVAPVAVVALEHVWPVIFPYQLAITQAPALPLVQIADLLGGVAISGLLVAVAGALVDLIDRGRAGWRIPAVAGGLLAVSLVYGLWRISDVDARRAAAPRVRIGLVQPNERMRLGVQDTEGDLARLEAMQLETRRLEAAGAQVVIWSETSYPPTRPRGTQRDLAPDRAWAVRRGFAVPVVIGLVTSDTDAHGPTRYNSSMLLVDDRFVARHDKIHRVLGSEWNPVSEWFPSLRDTLPPGFHGGAYPVVLPLSLPGLELRLGPMICLEDIIPQYARALAAERPNVLVNQTIDTWFGTFAEPWQHRALAVLRAIEVRADMVRAVNTGPSGLVEATGRIGAQTPVRAGAVPVEGLLVEVAVMEAGHTVYQVIGDLFAWLCASAALVGWWLGRREHKRNRDPKITPAPTRKRRKR